MSLRAALVCALAVSAISVAVTAQACPNSSRVRIYPPPGSTLTMGTPIVIDGISIDALDARGPILWSDDDVVPLRVIVSRPNHIELAIERDLADGTRYALALTRTAGGVALERAVAPVRYGYWSGQAAPVATVRTAVHRGLSWAQGLAFFGLLPFVLSFGLTGLILRRRQRRFARSIWL